MTSAVSVVPSRGVAERGSIVAESAQMRELVNLAERAASLETKILITGESGVGKDVIARHVHGHPSAATDSSSP